MMAPRPECPRLHCNTSLVHDNSVHLLGKSSHTVLHAMTLGLQRWRLPHFIPFDAK